MSEAHLIVANPARNAVLLTGGALPVVETSQVLRAGALLGVPIVVVRTQHRDGENRVVACEAAALPDGASWADERRALQVPRYADAVASWFDEEAGRVTVHRQPWLRHRWLDTTRAWARAKGPVTQLRHWGLSAVVRIGDVVVKQTLPAFAGEAAVLRWIYAIDPSIVPRVIEVDGDRWVMEAVDFVDGNVELAAGVQKRVLEALASLHNG